MNIYKHLIFSIVWFSIFVLVFLYTKDLNGTAITIAHISSGVLSFIYMLITLNSFFIIWRYLKLKKSNPQVFDNMKREMQGSMTDPLNVFFVSHGMDINEAYINRNSSSLGYMEIDQNMSDEKIKTFYGLIERHSSEGRLYAMKNGSAIPVEECAFMKNYANRFKY